MTDRELLKLAAKAAGVGWDEYESEWYGDGVRKDWNPLTNDGDAFRLAVTLRIEIMWPRPGDHVCAGNVREVGAGSCEDDLSDPYAATRRAITRAAAAIYDSQQGA